MKSFSAVFCCILLVTCTKEEVTVRNYPRVRTHSVDGITSQGAVLHGEITLATSEVTDHGFIWSIYPTLDLENAEVISLGPRNGKGLFSSKVERSLVTGGKYYVRAFARSDLYTVYGDVTEFISMGSKAPTILSFTPSKAYTLDTILISGSYFSDLKNLNLVRFGGFDSE